VEHGEVRNGEGKRRPRARVSVSSGRRHREWGRRRRGSLGFVWWRGDILVDGRGRRRESWHRRAMRPCHRSASRTGGGRWPDNFSNNTLGVLLGRKRWRWAKLLGCAKREGERGIRMSPSRGEGGSLSFLFKFYFLFCFQTPFWYIKSVWSFKLSETFKKITMYFLTKHNCNVFQFETLKHFKHLNLGERFAWH
jgi:hypothetical protein